MAAGILRSKNSNDSRSSLVFSPPETHTTRLVDVCVYNFPRLAGTIIPAAGSSSLYRQHCRRRADKQMKVETDNRKRIYGDYRNQLAEL